MPDTSPSRPVHLSAGLSYARIMLRGRPDDADLAGACRSVFGAGLPSPGATLRSGHGTVLWFGPDAWLILAEADDRAAACLGLERGLSGCGAVIVDVTAAWSSFRIEGPGIRDLLARGCPLDLDAARFPPGRCARSRLGPFSVLVHHRADIAAFELHVARSHGAALGRWLEDTARIL